MPTTFTEAGKEVHAYASKAIMQWHPDLREAKVQGIFTWG